MSTPTFLESLIEAAAKAAKPGHGVTWREVAQRRVKGAPVSDGDFRSVWDARATVMNALYEAGLMVVGVTERYFDSATLYDSGLTYSDEDLTRYLPYPGVGPAVGFHIAADSTDPLWANWRAFQNRKFGGGIASQSGQVLAAVAADGNVEGGKRLLKEGYRAATPKPIGTQIAAVLGTTGSRLLSDTSREQ